jgi:hypothetical protein
MKHRDHTAIEFTRKSVIFFFDPHIVHNDIEYAQAEACGYPSLSSITFFRTPGLLE